MFHDVEKCADNWNDCNRNNNAFGLLKLSLNLFKYIYRLKNRINDKNVEQATIKREIALI